MVQFIKSKATITPKKYILGTTVDIQTVLYDSLSSGDTITIQIEDSWDRIKVEDEAMTELTPSVYSYSWQSTVGGVTDEAGIYTAFISVVSGANTYVDTVSFEMTDCMEA